MIVERDAPISIVYHSVPENLFSFLSTHTVHCIYVDICNTTCSTDVTIPEGDMDNQHARFASLHKIRQTVTK